MSMRPGSRSITQLSDLRLSAPAEYARALRKAHEATVSGSPNAHLSPSLVKSWQRSLALGINPDQHRPVHRHEVSEAQSLSAGHRLAAAADDDADAPPGEHKREPIKDPDPADTKLHV